MGMTERHTCLGFSNATAGQEADYADWYRTVHLPDITAIEGVVSARRFEYADAVSGSPQSPWGGVALYGFSDTPSSVVGRIGKEVEEGRMPVHGAMEDVAGWVWSPIDESGQLGNWQSAESIMLVLAKATDDGGEFDLVFKRQLAHWNSTGHVESAQSYSYSGVSFDMDYQSPYARLVICSLAPDRFDGPSFAAIGEDPGVAYSAWRFDPVTNATR